MSEIDAALEHAFVAVLRQFSGGQLRCLGQLLAALEHLLVATLRKAGGGQLRRMGEARTFGEEFYEAIIAWNGLLAPRPINQAHDTTTGGDGTSHDKLGADSAVLLGEPLLVITPEVYLLMGVLESVALRRVQLLPLRLVGGVFDVGLVPLFVLYADG